MSHSKWVEARLQSLCSALAIALLLALVGSYILLWRAGAAGSKQTDFVPVYAASHLARINGGAIYNLMSLGHYERLLVWPLHVAGGVMPFLYPPYVAVAFAPLAQLPYNLAFVTWAAVNLILLVGTLTALQRYVQLSGRAALLFWTAGLAFPPVLLTLAQGQVSILLLALLLGAFLSIRAGNAIVGGALLSAALIKPTYVAPILLVLALQQRWRVLAGFAGGTVVLATVPVVLLGPSTSWSYVRLLHAATGWSEQIGGFAPIWNHSIVGFSELLLPSRLAQVVPAAAIVLGIGLLTGVTLTTWRLEVSFALAVLLGLVLSPHVLLHDLALLLIPVAIALRQSRRDVKLLVLLLLGYLAVSAALATTGALHIQFTVIAMILFACWLAGEAFHARGAEAVSIPHIPSGRTNVV